MARLRETWYSVVAIRREPTAEYAMVKEPDDLLVEVFEFYLSCLPRELYEYFAMTS
ncbi:hypothetical protein P5V47_20525 [Mycobacteroides abscessus subsp. massiliense]|uniref:hypothetical protein n=1 Tax=Mycobacteroides abscessus TaxID=36809 RepID=UPI00266C74C8|nr:hypothetical protein [Mycobacteroides abscessus]MDO3301080.1 hypothetical protein [Mycobacteroides abscessus subsp. massiliense]